MNSRNNHIILKQPYNHLITTIGQILEEGRRKALQSVNQILVKTYWEIGKQIVEFEQRGGEKAEYGSRLLERLTRDLKLRYGKGFNIRNLYLMRKFYLGYKNLQTLSAELSWSHYVELIGLEEELARTFYEKQSIKERWSVRELKRQITAMTFHRIALSRDKKGVLESLSDGEEHAYGDIERKANTNWQTVRDHCKDLELFWAVVIAGNKVKITKQRREILKKL